MQENQADIETPSYNKTARIIGSVVGAVALTVLSYPIAMAAEKSSNAWLSHAGTMYLFTQGLGTWCLPVLAGGGIGGALADRLTSGGEPSFQDRIQKEREHLVDVPSVSINH
ncbi:MAG: hypothetical protein EAY76_01115 [Alphaproteobacteria bacterium]|nr:MAG: hypothetical protein EAY76_01115 [Alphaproteobacteria bacterium]TAF76982.1 MAG: hypothetical protein EAZ52_02355 [Alphaproteobacteria bacterium]